MDTTPSEKKERYSAADLILNHTNNNSTKSEQPVPEDEGNTVLLIFYLWGIGVLLPWNAILSCFDFFQSEVSIILSCNLCIDGWFLTLFCLSVCGKWPSRSDPGTDGSLRLQII